MPNVRRTAAFLLVTGLALGQQACGSEAPQAGPASGAPSGSTTPGPAGPSAQPTATQPTVAPAGKGTASEILAGDRQISITLVEKPGGVLAVGSGDRVNLVRTGDDKALFVLEPKDDRYLIRTVGETGGRPSCLTGKSREQKSVILVTAACTGAAAKQQLFELVTDTKDEQGRPTFIVKSDYGGFLQYFPDGSGLIMEELGDAELETTFVLVDRGASPL